MELVTCASRGRVAVLTLDNPGRRNALSVAMARSLGSTLDRLRDDGETAAVVLTGAPPAFSAGADLDELQAADRSTLRAIYDGFLALVRFPLPVIAAVNGPAVGAGFNLALACDLRIAARGASFESRFTDLALHPGGGHAWMLQRLLGYEGATALLLCGEALNGEEAARRGLAWRCVADDRLLDEALALAERAATTPRELLARVKATLRIASDAADQHHAVERELKWQAWSLNKAEFRERVSRLKREITRD
jgi:enoyl-CoA hydratase